MDGKIDFNDEIPKLRSYAFELSDLTLALSTEGADNGSWERVWSPQNSR